MMIGCASTFMPCSAQCLILLLYSALSLWLTRARRGSRRVSSTGRLLPNRAMSSAYQWNLLLSRHPDSESYTARALVRIYSPSDSSAAMSSKRVCAFVVHQPQAPVLLAIPVLSNLKKHRTGPFV